MKDTPLHDLHVALGAKMVEFGGWHMPVQYGPILDEVRTVRSKAGLFDLSHMGRVRVTGTGPGRARRPHRDELLREDPGRRDPLRALLPRGRQPDRRPARLPRRGRGLPRRQRVEHRGRPRLDPRARARLRRRRSRTRPTSSRCSRSRARSRRRSSSRSSPDLDLASVGYYRFGFGTRLRAPADARQPHGLHRRGRLRALLARRARPMRVWKELARAGAAHGVAPIGLGARDTLRLEAGMPLYGHEIDATHNPIEAGLAFGVSFHAEKGDWIGRAALERVAGEPDAASRRHHDRRPARAAPGLRALPTGERRSSATSAPARSRRRSARTSARPTCPLDCGRARRRRSSSTSRASARTRDVLRAALLLADAQMTPHPPKAPAETMRPNDRRYFETHEWIKPDGDTMLIGITDFAVAGALERQRGRPRLLRPARGRPRCSRPATPSARSSR